MASASMGFSYHLFTASRIFPFVLTRFGTTTGADDSLPGVSDMINSQECGRSRFLFLGTGRGREMEIFWQLATYPRYHGMNRDFSKKVEMFLKLKILGQRKAKLFFNF